MKKPLYLILILFLLTGCQNTAEKPVDSVSIDNSTHNDSNITISFVGDIMTAESIYNAMILRGIHTPLEQPAPLLNSDDLTVGNLEMAITDKNNTKKPKGYHFNGHPDSTSLLKKAGVDVVSLANNHSLDYGSAGMIDTINTLSDHDILCLGAGKNCTEAYTPLITTINDTSIALVAYNAILPWTSWAATETTFGTTAFSSQYYNHTLKQIKRLNDDYDLVIVLLHWGEEYMTKPLPWQIQIAHEMIDAGADTIVGHHPHVLQGIEIYENKPILYSTGNFLFHLNGGKTDQTGIFQITYTNSTATKVQYLPAQLIHSQVHLHAYNSEISTAYIKDLKILSKEFNTIINKEGLITLPPTP